jgi:hypothetical protein
MSMKPPFSVDQLPLSILLTLLLWDSSKTSSICRKVFRVSMSMSITTAWALMNLAPESVITMGLIKPQAW